ncbi:hypothetical protein AB9E03_34260, partial [Rhizobium leguminosarum]
RVRRGIARTFQINQLFSGFTPLDSVLLAINERDGFGRSAWRPLAAHLDVLRRSVADREAGSAAGEAASARPARSSPTA